MTSISTQSLHDLLDAHKESWNALHVQSVYVISGWITGNSTDYSYFRNSMEIVVGRFIDFLSVMPGGDVLIGLLTLCLEDSCGW